MKTFEEIINYNESKDNLKEVIEATKLYEDTNMVRSLMTICGKLRDWDNKYWGMGIKPNEESFIGKVRGQIDGLLNLVKNYYGEF